MGDRTPDTSASSPGGAEPGISWLPGDEDYPFAARQGETALTYFERWLREAPYTSLEQDGVRYLHEADVTNVVNHITADVSLLRGRLIEFGDQVLTAADHNATTQFIEEATARLALALATLTRTGR